MATSNILYFHSDTWENHPTKKQGLWQYSPLQITGWWFQKKIHVRPYLGKIPILANIYPMGWNHQLAKVLEATRGWKKQRWDVGGGEASRWASPQTVFSTFQGWPIKSIGEITIGKIGKAAFGAPRCMYTYTFDIQ